MGLEQEIVEWSAGRPAWQRVLLRRIACGGDALTAEDLATHLVAGTTPSGEPLSIADMASSRATTGEPLRLLAIKNLAHVNALATGEALSFEQTGMTVVYGDNGCGKSGYARLLKSVVRARHREAVHSDIFSDKPDEQPSATLQVLRGEQQSEILWPGKGTDALASIGFFDEACGEAYLTADDEISYRPSSLAVLDGLIHACDAIRAMLDELLTENADAKIQLPSIDADTPAGRFLASLSPQSSPEQLAALCRMPDDIDRQVMELETEVVRLRTTDPAKERKRLLDTASKLDRLETHVARMVSLLDKKAESELAALLARFRTAETAAAVATRQSFEGEAVKGVGTQAWKTLWSAARAFAVEGARLPGEFPDTSEGAKCVLCQQTLDANAAERMRRFESFVQGKVQLVYEEARTLLDDAKQKLRSLDPNAPEISAIMEGLKEAYPSEVEVARDFLSSCSARRDSLVASIAGREWAPDAVSFSGAPPLNAAKAATEASRDH